MCMCLCVCVPAHARARACATHTHTHTHTLARAHTHTRSRARAHTHTGAPPWQPGHPNRLGDQLYALGGYDGGGQLSVHFKFSYLKISKKNCVLFIHNKNTSGTFVLIDLFRVRKTVFGKNYFYKSCVYTTRTLVVHSS